MENSEYQPVDPNTNPEPSLNSSSSKVLAVLSKSVALTRRAWTVVYNVALKPAYFKLKGRYLSLDAPKRRWATLSVVGVFVVILAFSFFGNGDSNGDRASDAPGSLASRGNSLGTYKVGDKARLGVLEVSVNNFKESTYSTFERNENSSTRERGYFLANVYMFNQSHQDNEVLSLEMVDDLGNVYKPDYSIAASLPNTKGFSWDKNYYPRTIREGELLFPPINERAKKLKLIFFSDLNSNKVIFEFDRDR